MQGGGKDISVGSPVVGTGGKITLTGTPGEVVFYKPDGVAGGGKTVTLGPDGKAEVPAPSKPCTITMFLVSDPLKYVVVDVIDTLK